MAGIPRAAKASERTAYSVCRSTQRLHPVHDRRTRSFAIFGAVPLLEDIELPEMVRGAASVVGEGEGRRCRRVPCDERNQRMESHVGLRRRTSTARLLSVRRDTRMVWHGFREGHSRTKNLYIRRVARRPEFGRGTRPAEVGEGFRSVGVASTSNPHVARDLRTTQWRSVAANAERFRLA